MSLEASIASLAQQAGLLMDLPQQVNAAAQAQIAAIGAAYQDRLGTLKTSFFVDQVNGLDTNAGTLASPFKSIGKALEQTPFGGYCEVALKADYHLAEPLTIDGRRLFIFSSGTKKRLTFARLLDQSIQPNYRYPASFSLLNRGAVVLSGLTVVYPDLTGYSSYPAARWGLVRAAYDECAEVSVMYCDIEAPADVYAQLLPSNTLAALYWTANTMTGARTSPNGLISQSATGTAGAAAASVPGLLTNLATI